jgi:acetyl-CoA acetyltransferase
MRSLRGAVAIVGIGESKYFKRGEATDSEFVLTLKAILAACADAGVDPTEVDGFASYSSDRNDPSRLASALGCKALTFSNMQWGGGGGGAAGSVANGAAAIATGLADCVVAFRGLAQGQFGRFGQGARIPRITGPMAHTIPYGLMSPAQMFAMKVVRFMHEHGVRRMRSAHLARRVSARATTCARCGSRSRRRLALDRRTVPPVRLLPRERRRGCDPDGARGAREDFPHKPVYLLGAAEGSSSAPTRRAQYAGLRSSGFKTSRRACTHGEVNQDVGVVQSYENFTGCVVMSMYEHGFFAGDEANEFLTFENLTAPGGRLPINTSGGNLAECYMHGFEMVIEAARQVRGDSPNQARRSDVSMMTAGPMIPPVSSIIFGSEATL